MGYFEMIDFLNDMRAWTQLQLRRASLRLRAVKLRTLGNPRAELLENLERRLRANHGAPQNKRIFPE